VRVEASTSGSSASHPQVDELTKLVKSLSAEVERLKLEGKKTYKNPKMLITEVTSGGLTMLLRLCKGNKGTEIEMIRKSRPLSKIILLLMMKERKKTSTQKSIVSEIHPLFLI
jgi:hypothetical protein